MEISRSEEVFADARPDEREPLTDVLPTPVPLAFTEDGRDSPRRSLSALDWTALIAVVAGGLNSGLIAAVNLDVIAKMLPHAAAARVVYALIGIAALYCVVLLFRLADDLSEAPR
ncbi:DUF378 domain-containing protein [Achromobacter spanius]|uniref:DUF378 domain-containing protein n=1 Tax=Achromobacter spanius TaxID=217203 RepID=A0A2S0I7Y3_9BURK|nr:DUF378 domain-containing protein [Achromobacter spanius]AVJ28054.1 DUF378 domain-containing protein [Achromobacter spanius]